MWELAGSRKKDVVFTIVILFVNVLFFHSLLNNDVLPLQMDNSLQNVPFHYYAFHEIKNGKLPLWCSDAALGFPFFAEGQSGAGYFFNWIFFITLPFVLAYNLSIIFHCLISGLGFYFFLRTIGTSEIGSLMGGTIWSLNGFFLRKLMFVNYVRTFTWLPWILAFWIFNEKNPQKYKQYILVFLIFFMATAGHPQALIQCLFIIIFFILFSTKYSRFYNVFKRITIIFGFGLGLAAYQWVPTLYTLVRSYRHFITQKYNLSVQMSFSPGFILALFFPDPFGNAAENSFHGGWGAYEWEISSYLGVAAIFFAVFADQKDRLNKLFLGMAIWGIVLALGKYSPIYTVIDWIPIIGSLRVPSRWLALFVFGVSGLAGRGCMVLWSNNKNVKKGLMIKFLLMLSCLMLLIVILVINSSSGFHLLLSAWLWKPFLFIFLLALLLTLEKKKVRIINMTLVFAFIVSDYFMFGMRYQGIGDKKYILSKPSVVEKHIIIPERDYRILSLTHETVSPWNWHSGWSKMSDSDYVYFNNCFQMYSGLLYNYDLITFNELSPLHDARYINFLQRFKGCIPISWLNRLSARYIIVSKNTISFDLPEVYENSFIQIYENENAFKKWRVGKTGYNKVIPVDYMDKLSQDESTGKIFRQEKKRGCCPVRIKSLNIVSSHPGNIELNVTAIEGSSNETDMIIHSELFLPGWEAIIDGETVDIKEVDSLFQGLVVQPGKHYIKWRYFPKDFWIGYFIFVFGIFFLIVKYIAHGKCNNQRSSIGQLEPDFLVEMSWIVGLIVLFLSIILRWTLWIDSFLSWNLL